MNEETQTALAAPAPMQELATLTEDQLAEREAAIRRAADAKKRLVKAAMTLLYPKDWVAQGEKMYLQGEGAMRLAAVGIKLSEPVYSVEKLGDDYFVECLLEAEWPACGQVLCETGTCNTRDKFWNSDRERSEINQIRQRAEGNEALARRMLLGHVKKKAYMNAVSRAVTGVMGIRGLTNAELADVGFTPEKAAAQVTYKGKKKADKTTGKLETITPEGLKSLAVGSKVALRGKMLGEAQVGAKSTRFMVGDINEKFTIFVRGTDPVDERFGPGADVYFPEIEASEFQGKLNFWANKGIEVVEPEAPGDE